MNKQQLQGAFDAVRAPDTLVDTVLSGAERRPHPLQRRWVRVAAIAAALAILFTALTFWPFANGDNNSFIAVPGIMKAYAYEVEDQENVDFTQLNDYRFWENNVPSWKNMYFPLGNYELAITPVIDEEMYSQFDIRYEVFTNHGVLVGNYHNPEIYPSYTDAILGDYAQIGNGETLYWEGWELTSTGERADEFLISVKEKIYIDVIIKADTHIIGYAVFEIIRVPDAYPLLTAVLVKSIHFPMVDGAFQAITEVYVNQQLQNTKAE